MVSSAPELLALHGVRVLGAPSIDDVARLFDLGALARHLDRFSVHSPRHRFALDRVQSGERAWLDAPGRASCHLAWISFHEDLLATLGIQRGTEESLRSNRR